MSVDGSENNGTVSADVADTGVNLEASATTMDDQPVADDDVDDTPFDNDPTVSQGQGPDYIGVDGPSRSVASILQVIEKLRQPGQRTWKLCRCLKAR